MNPNYIYTLFSKFINWFFLLGKSSHQYNVKKSYKILNTLKQIQKEEKILAYIRKIDPNVFEELVLSTLQRDGVIVLRNRRYTADGGIDGRIYFPKFGFIPIQAKRYSQSINPSHITDFENLFLKKNFQFGIFVHTGRTGDKSYSNMNKTILLSGFNFANILSGKSNSKLWLNNQVKLKHNKNILYKNKC